MVALTLGTSLNPLNSSMIAVALLALQRDFALDLKTVTWVITAFYIASIVCQPLVGRIVDAFGPRRTFVVGMALVILASALAPLGGSFLLVCIARVGMAIGSSAAFPSALALVGPLGRVAGIPVPRLIARIQVTNTAAAALGPVLGGVAVTFAGWEAVFWVNVPLALAALIGVLAFAPRDGDHPGVSPRALAANLDPLGVVLFGTGMTAVLLFVLEPSAAVWYLIAGGVLLLVAFVWWERRARLPFIDVRMVWGNHALRTVYLAFTVFCALFYLAFFGIAPFLEAVGGYSSAMTGLLLLPLSAITVVLAPVVARIIERRGVRPVLVWGAVLVVPGAALLAIGAVTTAPVPMLLMAAVLGIPYCMVSLAAPQLVQQSAPREAIGVASGLLQSARYIGAIIATVLLGRLLQEGITASNWFAVAVAATVIAVVHLVIVLTGMVWRRQRANG